MTLYKWLWFIRRTQTCVWIHCFSLDISLAWLDDFVQMTLIHKKDTNMRVDTLLFFRHLAGMAGWLCTNDSAKLSEENACLMKTHWHFFLPKYSTLMQIESFLILLWCDNFTQWIHCGQIVLYFHHYRLLWFYKYLYVYLRVRSHWSVQRTGALKTFKIWWDLVNVDRKLLSSYVYRAFKCNLHFPHFLNCVHKCAHFLLHLLS